MIYYLWVREMKVYLASPLFTEYEKDNVREWAKRLREEGHEVYVPMEHQIENAWNMSNSEWGYKVFQEDVKAIDEAEMVIVLYYGLYSDSGTAWEQGYAYAKGKQVQVINAGSCAEASLMIINGQTCYDDREFAEVYQM